MGKKQSVINHGTLTDTINYRALIESQSNSSPKVKVKTKTKNNLRRKELQK